MSFRLTAFSDLVASYPSWPDLRTYLTSTEGGSLRVVDGSDSLCIVRYTKGVSDFNLPHVGLFRSVVWNKETNRPVSVAPVKALPGSPAEGAEVQVSDFVDGVMIQAFRPVGGPVRIATRTSLDARGTFYSQKTFAELFEEAVRTFGGSQVFLKSVLEEGMFCSMILQHREHKTVAPVPYPRIFVTQVGSVAEDGTVTVYTDCGQWPQRLMPLAPHVHDTVVADADTKKILHTASGGRDNYQWQGLVFQEVGTARRWRLRNPNYVAVRTLRGAEATAVGRFVRLRGDGTMKEYLKYFREESSEMWRLEQLLRERTQELYFAYNAVHKAKNKGLKDLPYSLRPHVYALHGLYLKGLPQRPAEGEAPAFPSESTSILKSKVIDYVNQLAREDQVRLLEGDREAPKPTVS